MTLDHIWATRLHKVFDRIPSDQRWQRVMEHHWYKRLRGFLNNTVCMVATSLSLSVSTVLLTNPGVALSGAIGLLFGVSTTFISAAATKRLNQWENDLSSTSNERREKIEATLHMLERLAGRANSEVFENALKKVMRHLKDPSTSYALWAQVNECLHAIDHENERHTAATIQQQTINIAVEQLDKKLNPPKDRVLKI